MAGVACLTAAQMSMPSNAQQASADAAQECPARWLQPPKYPMAMAKAGKGGHGVVSVAFDACGRVVDARMAKTTGRSALDEASLAAAKTWTLGKPEPDWKLVEGRFEAPVDFLPPTEVKMHTPKQLGWPDSHRRPRYRLEPSEQSFAESQSLISKGFLAGRIGAPVYKEGVFVATGSAAEPEFWYQSGGLAARYRPVMENGEPVVKVMVVCAAPNICSQLQPELLKGLPFAKAKN
ncbi:energy transducer TonB [Lysobacter niastensis]|uniref:TonB family protein n=1 Tax=Lysobacter niastensis TaxID=380629 RepID=A0ABS0B577_9GAMM|nr:energy transducer TonB [Lysobacter niastensis]MBF6023843.1 TonB family protein [Lysobacter niastensis]